MYNPRVTAFQKGFRTTYVSHGKGNRRNYYARAKGPFAKQMREAYSLGVQTARKVLEWEKKRK